MDRQNRRHLLTIGAYALSSFSGLAIAGSPARRFPAGLVAGSRTPFWQTCDLFRELGVRRIEINNTHQKLVESYESRISEFRDEMARRDVTLIGSAMYSHMHVPELREELIAQHLRVARFLKAVGGLYMNPLLAPGSKLGNGTDEEYRKVNSKAWAANATAIGKRVREETGIRIGLHPEQGDIRAGQLDAFLDAVNPKAFGIWPDVGHFAACGVDPDFALRKYKSRIIGVHLRDYKDGRMVPFGEGTVNLRSLVEYLAQIRFTGPVLGEGPNHLAMRDYMARTLQIRF